MVVEHGSARIKAARMPRLFETEVLAVQVMAELVAKSAEERTERSHLLPDGRPHPEADEHGFGIVVPEQQRAGSQYSYRWLADFIEAGGKREKR